MLRKADVCGARVLCLALLVAHVVALRAVALSSDPYARLDWSAGQLTDEGFYVHNARNVALFGHARTDEFNNMLLAPALHGAQVAVFSTFGVGSVQARGLSVACSLLMLWLLWAALRRVFGPGVAWAAAGVLGLDHVSLLYHRMALMDTPASLGAVAAFYGFVQGQRTERAGARAGWMAACGALLALTITNRSLCIYLAPAPFVAIAAARRSGRARDAAATAAGMAAVVAVYAAAWYLPHRSEIDAMARYYRLEQIQPRSWGHLAANVYHAFLGDSRGFSPYLFRHTPVVAGLLTLALAAWVARGRGPSTGDDLPGSRAPYAYLVAWLVGGLAVLAVIGYSPSRYYVTVYPAMMALAVIAAARLPALWQRLRRREWRARACLAGAAVFAAYHVVQAFTHRAPGWPSVALAAAPVAAGALALAWPRGASEGADPAPGARRRWAVALGVLWLGANGWWMAGWLRGMAFTQRDTSRWLARTLPEGAVLLGDVAPGLCLDNRFAAVNVIPGLCNADAPVERFAGRPRFIAILDGRWKERYWMERYPRLVAPERRLAMRQVLRWTVGIYPVEWSRRPAGGSNGLRTHAKKR